MSNKPQYYIVEASALPEVFLKVAETKRLLSTGEATTVNEATRMTDISRSAFYKYRDAVMPFQKYLRQGRRLDDIILGFVGHKVPPTIFHAPSRAHICS